MPLGLSNEVLLGISSSDVVAPSPTKSGIFARQNQVDQGQSQKWPLLEEHTLTSDQSDAIAQAFTDFLWEGKWNEQN